MKKLFLSYIRLIMAVLLITGSASAQRTISASLPGQTEATLTTAPGEAAKAEADIKDINVRAVKSFNKQYKDARNVKWSNADKTIMAYFENDGVQNRVIYLKNGRWLHTLLSYGPARLPESVRDIVESNFRNYNIGWITEVQGPENVIYFVNIENAKYFRQVAVCNENFSIYKTLRKTQ
jgi:hypothetical protein